MRGERHTHTPLPRSIGDVQSGSATCAAGRWIEQVFTFGIHWTFRVAA